MSRSDFRAQARSPFGSARNPTQRTALTDADRKRMAEAVKAGERRRRTAAARERLARLAVGCISIVATVMAFYSVANSAN